jgi:hypothetical protein
MYVASKQTEHAAKAQTLRERERERESAREREREGEVLLYHIE